jgi:ABC-type transport system substrate-binding protein
VVGLEYATAAKLYNWSDRGTRLVPEVAARFAVSNNGRTYTFLLRRGFRFSDGSPVTAKNFTYAFERIASPELASPGAQFAANVRSVRAKGPYKLVIRLARPEQTFISKLTMPFFQATSKTLPSTREVVVGHPSAGPYFFATNEPNSLTTLRRNPYWHGPRPAHVAGVEVRWNLDEETAFHQVGSNQIDEGPLPLGEVEGVLARYGVNKTRFWSKPNNCIGFLALNSRRPLFRRVAMRKAINWAIDRAAMADQSGPAAATPWTHILPPLFPGSVTRKRLQPYAVHPNLAKARTLARSSLGHRRITIAYGVSGTINFTNAVRVRRL